MKKIFIKYPVTILVVLAAVFLCMLAGYFGWGVGDIATQLDRALMLTKPQQNASFDIKGAQKLDLHGLAD